MVEPARAGQVIGRRWKYAPPPWRMFEALTDELDRWLVLADGEAKPTVAQDLRPGLVVFDPWVNEVIDRVEVEISEDGDYGSSLRIVATAKVPALPDEQRRRVRYRLGAIFGGALREWVDDPH